MRLNCSKFGLFLAVAAVLSVAGTAQESSPTASLDARSLVRAALDNQKAADDSQTRYTDFRHVRETNRDEKGKVRYRFDRLFEETWINDLPYERLVERDGKPLRGADLKREQALYDEAIQGRHPLGNTERIKLEGAHPVSSGVHLSDALKDTYTVTEVGREPSPDGVVRVVEAAHVRSKSSSCSWRYRFWITDDGKLMRFHADVAPNDGATSCGDATEDQTRILIDGLPRLATSRAHFYVESERGWITVDSNVTFTKYRRFSTKVTISPATLAPADQP